LTRGTMFNYYYNWRALTVARTTIQATQCIASAYIQFCNWFHLCFT